MNLVLDLSPELRRRLEQAAARRGVSPEECARELLEEQLETAEEIRSPYAGLPTKSAEELEALLQERGAKPVQNLDDLKGDFWPEDDDIDEFIATLRRWRRGEP